MSQKSIELSITNPDGTGKVVLIRQGLPASVIEEHLDVAFSTAKEAYLKAYKDKH